jgi:hypothetical protein
MPDNSEKVPVIAVASGKGGVGKITVAVNLALALTAQGHRTGLIDADLYGPDVPRMMGLRRRAEASSVTLFARPGAPDSRLQTVSQHGVQLASTAFLLGENQALAFQGGIRRLGLQSDQMLDRLHHRRGPRCAGAGRGQGSPAEQPLPGQQSAVDGPQAEDLTHRWKVSRAGGDAALTECAAV